MLPRMTPSPTAVLRALFAVSPLALCAASPAFAQANPAAPTEPSATASSPTAPPPSPPAEPLPPPPAASPAAPVPPAALSSTPDGGPVLPPAVPWVPGEPQGPVPHVDQPAWTISVPPPNPPLIPTELSLAGYRNATFFVRSQDDFFRLYLMGRVHVDWTDQFGPGTSNLGAGSNLYNGFYLRRARIELAGEIANTWQWQVSGEFSSSTAVDNAAATMTTPTCTANPTTGALPCTNNENPVQNPTVKAIPTDVFVNYGPHPLFNVEVGQYYLPFTLENRISDNTTPFLERSVAVRNIGAPLQRDIGAMAWGETPNRLFYYAVAFLNGDGPNRVNVDTRYEVAGRVFVRPLATTTNTPSKWSQLGFSIRQSSADPTRVGYDLPNMTTQEGFPFWKATYKDSFNRTIHIMPSTGQWGIAGDLFVPIENFDFTGEFIYVVDNTREAVDGYQISPFTERLGNLKGFGWYAQASYWLFGNHDIIGYPSYGRPIHLDLTQPQRPHLQGVQILAKFEQLHMTYEGSDRGGANDPKTPNGTILANDVEFGVNYWATRHLRVGLNYTLYSFPSSEPVTATGPGTPVQSSVQRAIAPAQLLAKGADDQARDNAHTMSEISARVGVQF
jgi:phosphate-selective porin